MGSGLIDKLTDTLAKRLFLLIWAALVASHMPAFAVVMIVHFNVNAPGAAALPRELPTFPSLPPPRRACPMSASAAVSALARASIRTRGRARPSARPARLPMNILLLDYAARLLVIALAAWYGARRVAAPMRRLAAASRARWTAR